MAAVVGVHVSSTPVHADPITPAAHNGVTVWTGTDSTDFDVWDIRGLMGALGAATLTTSEGIIITADQAGAGGHDITVAIVAPGIPNAPLSITVNVDGIVVALATNASGTPTSTAAQVVAAINADVAAGTLVNAATGGAPDSALVGAMPQTALAPVTFEAGSYADSYQTVFSNSATHPQHALITHLGGLSIPAGATFLYVKDGNQEPAFYVYDLLAPLYAWNGVDDLHLDGFWPPNGSISSIKIFGTPAAVPEASSITLLAIGLATRAWSRKRGVTTRS